MAPTAATESGPMPSPIIQDLSTDRNRGLIRLARQIKGTRSGNQHHGEHGKVHCLRYSMCYIRFLDRIQIAMTAHEIKKVRTALGLTQQGFAAVLGVSFAAVNRWEKGHNEPQRDRLLRIHQLHQEYLVGLDTAVEMSVRERPAQLDFEGDPEAVRLIVDAFRLRNGHLFNKAYGLELSRVVPLPHQRIAVYENLL